MASVGPVNAQNCTGDCDGGHSVSLAEVVRGVTIALGKANVAECRPMDRSGDNRIGIDELVEAVTNSVSGCPSQRVSRAASNVALSSVRTVINFGSIAAGGGGGGVGVGLQRKQPTESLQGGAAGSNCQTLFCDLGGTETTCCLFGEVQISRDQCKVGDQFQTFTYNGFVSLTSPDLDFDPCSQRVPPFGSSFVLSAEGFTGLVEDTSGNFDFEMANYTEEFEGAGTSCFPSQFDPFAFGIRGDGFRTLNGSVQRVIGNRSSGPTFDSTTTARDLTLDVILSFDSFSNDCDVSTEVDGRVDGSDAITGVQTSQTYDVFDVDEEPGFDGTFFLGLNGDLDTDCLGPITLETEDFLELPPSAVCPVSGKVLITTPDDTTTGVAYTSGGGVTFDVGNDGIIEDARDSCLDLNLSECLSQTGNQTCASCSSSSECGSGFECAGCLFCEFSDLRCVPQGDFAFCGDDLYGDFSIDF